MAITGTKEWSVKSVNCHNGCKYQCRYCYARSTALRQKRITQPDEWGNSYCNVRKRDARRRHRNYGGTVMFPTTHDIWPEILDPCLMTIGNLLDAGNHVLIVSKPNRQCIEAMCQEFDSYHESILFRFTIGSADNDLLRYWEPNAPSFDERLDCLKHAASLDYRTSVSAEPLLDVENVAALWEAVAPFATDSIWIGKMNRVRQRVLPGTSEAAIEAIERGQTDEAVQVVYEQFRDHPLARWKESYKTVLGLTLANKPGEDK